VFVGGIGAEAFLLEEFPKLGHVLRAHAEDRQGFEQSQIGWRGGPVRFQRRASFQAHVQALESHSATKELDNL